MPELNPAREGYASFRGHRTRFRVIGQRGSRRPLLCLHDGPAFGCEYLHPLEEMHHTGRQVVFYDQLGCGASDHPDAGTRWSMELFIEELCTVRAAAGLDRCHVLGHGWGGMLALEYALTRPEGLESLVLSSTVASVPQWRGELDRLIEALPEELRGPLHRLAKGRAEDSDPASRALVDAFMRRHLCRMRPWPECLERSIAEGRSHPELRRALLGAGELRPGGALAEWDVSARLTEIQCPVLVVSGRHDMVPPPAVAALYRGIPSSEWVVFENSAHVPHLEEPQRYLEVLDGFLNKVEDAQRQQA